MKALERMKARAQEAMKQPLERRAYRFEDIEESRRDTRATEALGERQEPFALAMSDFIAANRLSDELPMLARVSQLSGDETMRRRVLDQLGEMAGWSPLQRPGWTLFRPGDPPERNYNDGTWLATGTGVWAVLESVRLLGETLPEELESRLEDLLEQEIDLVFSDFADQRQWFTKGNGAPACNQWVLPLCGLLGATVFLGTSRSRHAGRYEAAVAKLNRSLDTQGKHGDFVEGLSYASFTLTNWLRTARLLRDSGDERLTSHPYLPLFTKWLGQMILPDDWVINVCDCGITRLDTEERLDPVRELAAELLLAVGTGEAAWLVDRLGVPATPSGVEAEDVRRGIEPVAPPRFGTMDDLGVIAWRTGWSSNDHAVWIRTSGGLSSHTHADSAHLSLYRSGRPILIEAGTPTYGHPDIGRSFASGAGHNVLQIGTEWPEAYMGIRDIPGWIRRDTPVHVRRCDLSDEGGAVDLSVDPSGYERLDEWSRTCSWNARASLEMIDSVKLNRPAVVLFRFHLGVDAEIVQRSASSVRVSMEPDQLELTGSVPIEARLVPWPGPDERVGDHLCLIVSTDAEADRFELTTTITDKA